VLCNVAKAAKTLASALAAYAQPFCVAAILMTAPRLSFGRPSSVDFHLEMDEPSLQILFIQPKPLRLATATWAAAHVGSGYLRWMLLAVFSAIACVSLSENQGIFADGHRFYQRP